MLMSCWQSWMSAFSTYNYGSGRLYAIVGLDRETDFEPLDQVFENLQRHFKFF